LADLNEAVQGSDGTEASDEGCLLPVVSPSQSCIVTKPNVNSVLWCTENPGLGSCRQFLADASARRIWAACSRAETQRASARARYRLSCDARTHPEPSPPSCARVPGGRPK